jgi:hypothetical protein
VWRGTVALTKPMGFVFRDKTRSALNTGRLQAATDA